MISLEEAYTYMWREEVDADYPMHTYITKGTHLFGWVQQGTKDVVMFNVPKRTWSVTRRKFRKLNKKEIAELCMSTNV
jgi:hypothetical protein